MPDYPKRLIEVDLPIKRISAHARREKSIRYGQNATCILVNYYQFFREVIFALELGGSFVLLSDERSPTFSCDGPQGKRGLMPFLLSLLPESVHDRIATVSIQQVVAAIRSSGRHEWIAEFERKHGLM